MRKLKNIINSNAENKMSIAQMYYGKVSSNNAMENMKVLVAL
jgi:hypothetical protein